MIHGWISPQGKLVLGADTPTEQYALVCWFANYNDQQPVEKVVLEIVVNKEAEPRDIGGSPK